MVFILILLNLCLMVFHQSYRDGAYRPTCSLIGMEGTGQPAVKVLSELVNCDNNCSQNFSKAGNIDLAVFQPKH